MVRWCALSEKPVDRVVAENARVVITKNMLKLAAIVSITVTALYSLMNVGFGALLVKDIVIQILSIQSGTLVSLCGLEAYVNRRNNCNGNGV